MRRAVLFLAMAAAFFSAVASATADEAHSRVEIGDFFAKGDTWYFTGTVSSPKSKCEIDRKVILYARNTETGELGERVGSDRTERDGRRGRWVIEHPSGRAGTFVAKVKRTRRGSTVCRADRSPDFPNI